VLFYYITLAPKCFVLAAAADIVELRVLLLNKICRILQFLLHFVNSAHDALFWTRCSILHKILHVRNRRILKSLR